MPITPAPAVIRACEVLHHLSRHAGIAFSVSELARDLDFPRATCDSVLQALADGALVTRRDDRRYEIGSACIALGDAARATNPILSATCVEAEALARAIAACTAVSVRRGNESYVAEVFDFGPPFGARAQVGQSIAHTPPFGAAYVAWNDDDAAAWMQRGGTQLTARARTQLRRALDEVRRRGYSVSLTTPRRPELVAALSAIADPKQLSAIADPTQLSAIADPPEKIQARRVRDEVAAEMQQHEYLATAVDDDAEVRVSHMAAPVFDHTGRAVASILLLGPDYAAQGAELRARGEALKHAAARATKRASGRVSYEQ